MISKIAVWAVKLALPFLPLDQIKTNLAPVLALGATLNPINLINWIVLGLTTLFFFLFNPFGVANQTDKDGKTRKSLWTAFMRSFWMLIPMFFIYWLVIYYALKFLV